jgi:hypothetical protein
MRACGVYAFFQWRLGVLLHVLGVPFIAPRQLGAVGALFRRPLLPSVRGCIRQYALGTRHGIPWLAGFRFWGHQTVQCACRPLASADVTTSRCATGTTDCPTHCADHLVNYSRRRLKNSRAASSAEPCTGLYGGWHRTVRCYRV